MKRLSFRSFLITPHFFNLLGYGIVFVNFRGSLGVSKSGVESLPGYIGDLDVKDCKQALDEALAKYHRVHVVGLVAALPQCLGPPQFDPPSDMSCFQPVLCLTVLSLSLSLKQWFFGRLPKMMHKRPRLCRASKSTRTYRHHQMESQSTRSAQ